VSQPQGASVDVAILVGASLLSSVGSRALPRPPALILAVECPLVFLHLLRAQHIACLSKASQWAQTAKRRESYLQHPNQRQVGRILRVFLVADLAPQRLRRLGQALGARRPPSPERGPSRAPAPAAPGTIARSGRRLGLPAVVAAAAPGAVARAAAVACARVLLGARAAVGARALGRPGRCDLRPLALAALVQPHVNVAEGASPLLLRHRENQPVPIPQALGFARPYQLGLVMFVTGAQQPDGVRPGAEPQLPRPRARRQDEPLPRHPGRGVVPIAAQLKNMFAAELFAVEVLPIRLFGSLGSVPPSVQRQPRRAHHEHRLGALSPPAPTSYSCPAESRCAQTLVTRPLSNHRRPLPYPATR